MLAGVGYEIACPSSTLRIGRLSKRFIFYATLPKGTRLKKRVKEGEGGPPGGSLREDLRVFRLRS